MWEKLCDEEWEEEGKEGTEGKEGKEGEEGEEGEEFRLRRACRRQGTRRSAAPGWRRPADRHPVPVHRTANGS